MHPENTDRRTLFGVEIDALTMDETIARVRALVASRQPHQHVVLNASKVVQLSDDEALADIIRSCDLVNADGASVVWASRLLGRALPERVAGIDLMERLLGAAESHGWSVYFLGARAEVVDDVVKVSTQRHPGLLVAGSHDGYWDDDRAVIEAVRQTSPDILFLAIPSPRKEFWLHEHLDELGVPFVMGVGGAFDVVAGRTSRAPRSFQRLGLEWLWRLGQEPRRMAKRYLVGNVRFAGLVARELLSLRAGRLRHGTR